MNTKAFFYSRKLVMSAEVFPPKATGTMEGVIRALKEIRRLSPDYVSVTYSAGGGGGETTADVASVALDAFELTTVAHLTAVNMDKEKVLHHLEIFKKKGIENVLALRGDLPADARFYDFRFASDLVVFIKEQYPEFNILGACYPEGHIESSDIESDVEMLKLKVDAGVSQLVTQLFFDCDKYFEFAERLDKHGIDVPVSAGIMPLVNANQMKRMLALSGASVPDKLSKLLGRYETNPQGLFDAGIDYAIGQIETLAAHGVKGIHLYTMNNGEVAKRIFTACEKLRW